MLLENINKIIVDGVVVYLKDICIQNEEKLKFDDNSSKIDKIKSIVKQSSV